MQAGITEARQTIALLSHAYLRSVYGQAEWQAAARADPLGLARKLIPIRIEDCPRPGLLGQIVSIDMFGVTATAASRLLQEHIRYAISGRAKPTAEPQFPFPQMPGDATPPVKPQDPVGPVFPPLHADRRPPVREVGEVFQPTGTPEVTFVQQQHFLPFKMTLRQPGLSIVLEGPSGLGKTSLLMHAMEQDKARFGEPTVYSARVPRDVEKIDKLVIDGHDGVIAIDDHHRLSIEQQGRVVDYLKRLADSGARSRKIVVVGIPETARSLVKISPDIANRIRIFRPKAACENELLALVELGEKALNIQFEDKLSIVRASSGSLITAQALCWHLVTMARIEETARSLKTVRTDIRSALELVSEELRIKYHELVEEFAALDDSDETICIELLIGLAKNADGVLYLDEYRKQNPKLSRAVDRLFMQGIGAGLAGNTLISGNLFYDVQRRRLIADDPQFIFYIRQLKRERLLRGAGKRSPTSRRKVFICYSHQDEFWLNRLLVHLSPLERDGRLDVWSDKRIRIGDAWRSEIDMALDSAASAILLISADFLASSFIRDVELPKLLAAADNRGCRIVPILVAASAFHQTPAIARFQHPNPRSRTLAAVTREEAEQVLAEVARLIEPQ